MNKRKRKKRNNPQHKEKYLFIHFTDDDIAYYTPEFCTSKEQAIARFKSDIAYIAMKEGYKTRDVFRPNINDISRRIEERWAEE